MSNKKNCQSEEKNAVFFLKQYQYNKFIRNKKRKFHFQYSFLFENVLKLNHERRTLVLDSLVNIFNLCSIGQLIQQNGIASSKSSQETYVKIKYRLENNGSEPRLNDIGVRLSICLTIDVSRSEPRLNDIGGRRQSTNNGDNMGSEHS